MNFKEYTIAPKGRNKYGSYTSTGNISNKIVKYNNGGDNTTGGGNGTSTAITTSVTWNMALSQTSCVFDGDKLIAFNQSASTQLFGFVGTDRVQTFIGDISKTDDTANYAITGLSSGISVNVVNNGTSATTLVVTAASGMSGNQGNLIIPCNIFVGRGSITDEQYTISWNNFEEKCMKVNMEFSWSVSVSTTPSSSYVLDLTNENASVNVDSAGTIYTASTAQLSCRAQLYYGDEVASGVTYGLTTPASQGASGVSINTSTGVLSFGSNFGFISSPLVISVNAVCGTVTRVKTMTIVKSFPGADGSPAISKWINLSATSVKYDPNTGIVFPEYVTAKVMKQEGGDAPIELTGETIYYGFDTVSPSTTGASPVTVQIDESKDSLTFALKSGITQYETETVPILKNGVDGQGSNVYKLDLTNQNASINADSAGTIYAGAVRPECQAILYYGAEEATGVTYTITSASTSYTGLSINSSTGVLTLNAGTDTNPFNFTGDYLAITIKASQSSIVRGKVIFNITKSKQGAQGAEGTSGSPATSYWFKLSANAISVNTGGTASPSTITAAAWKQVGENAPEIASEASIKYGYNTVDPQTTYSSEITVDGTKNYMTFHLIVDNVIRVVETVPINRDGQSGSQGRKGAAMRGPVKWDDIDYARYFYNGTTDELFWDVIVRNTGGTNQYYYCNTTYYQPIGATWASVQSAWTETDESFNFVATNLLLANNAKINFMSGNEIYLINNEGDVTGGARGSNSANTINFWAGAESPSTNAPFYVQNDGTMTAKKGVFGCMKIGADQYGGALVGKEHYDTYDVTRYASISPSVIEMEVWDGDTETPEEGTLERVIIAPYADLDKYDLPGTINVFRTSGETSTGIYANNRILADGGFVKYADSSVFGQVTNTFAPMVVGMNGLMIMFCTSNSGSSYSSYFTKNDDGYWYFHGLKTDVLWATFGYVNFCSDTSSKYYGYWMFGTSSNDYTFFSGVATPYAIKKDNIIYITF